ncbi:MAG TPA: hypothetical protein VFA71_15200 [Terriglobales bacterium]|nr:hypothetical protein [Terriglobales bacterium]
MILLGILALFVHFGFFARIILPSISAIIYAVLSTFLAYNGRNTTKNRDAGSLVLGGSCLVLAFSIFLLGLDVFSMEPSSIRVITGNEARAAQTLHLLAEANATYAKLNNQYASSLNELDQSEILQSAQKSDAALVEDVIREGAAAGYSFNYSKRSDSGFQIVAIPRASGKSGSHFLYMDETLKLHWDLNKPATSQSPTVE